MSDEWIDALDAAARSRTVPDDDPLAAFEMTLEQTVEGHGAWRLIIDRGDVSVRRSTDGDPDADVRIACDEGVARAIANGERAALDAFIAGELRIGGDVGALIDSRPALETLGDMFASLGTA